MIVYSSCARDFCEHVDSNMIIGMIESEYLKKLGAHPGPGEKGAWRNSLGHMERVVRRSGVPDDCGVLVEFVIPATSKRIDFVITGKDEQEQQNMVVVELKQWVSAKATDMDDIVITAFRHGEQPTTHPSYQARAYSDLLTHFNEAVQTDGIQVQPCGYLHNYRPSNPEPLLSSVYRESLVRAPLYFQDDQGKLEAFLHQHVGQGKGMEMLFRIDQGRIRPSRQLMDSVRDMMDGNVTFTLIDEQKVAYESIMKTVRASRDSRKRMTIIVRGGPGTGKSVISMQAFSEMIRMSQNARFVAPNASFRDVMQTMLLDGRSRERTMIQALFAGSGSFWDMVAPVFDVLVVDEAHRLKGKGAYQYRGVNQVDDIIRASIVNIFFIDEEQQIRPTDIGSVEEIHKFADKYNSPVFEHQLETQFRCSGATGYLAWVEDVLRIKRTANYDGWDRDAFEFAICDSPGEIRERIRNKQKEGFRARLLAGYAWPWSPERDNPNGEIADVAIPEFGFAMPWNSRRTSTKWAIDPKGIDQIGCVHTSQGLEFDYVGVLIGDDLEYLPDMGSFFSDYRKTYDTTGKKGLKEDQQRLNQYIRNIYRILLSRGMKGCYVFCTDPKLQAYMRKRIGMMWSETNGHGSHNNGINYVAVPSTAHHVAEE